MTLYIINQKRERSQVEEKRGRERGLCTAKGRGNLWWEIMGEELEGGSLFGIAVRPLRGVASVSMGFAAFAN